MYDYVPRHVLGVSSQRKGQRTRMDTENVSHGDPIFPWGLTQPRASVRSITRRSMPIPTPPVGGIPCSSACRNSGAACRSHSPAMRWTLVPG